MTVRIHDRWGYDGQPVVRLENSALGRNPRVSVRPGPLEANADDWFAGGWDDAFPTGDACRNEYGDRLPYMGERGKPSGPRRARGHAPGRARPAGRGHGRRHRRTARRPGRDLRVPPPPRGVSSGARCPPRAGALPCHPRPAALADVRAASRASRPRRVARPGATSGTSRRPHELPQQARQLRTLVGAEGGQCLALDGSTAPLHLA